MATEKSFVQFIIDQINVEGEITAKSMFGEYGIFCDSRIFGLICDNKLYIKPTKAGRDFIGNVTEAAPYQGAKNSFLIEGKLNDSEWLSNLVRVTAQELSGK